MGILDIVRGEAEERVQSLLHSLGTREIPVSLERLRVLASGITGFPITVAPYDYYYDKSPKNWGEVYSEGNGLYVRYSDQLDPSLARWVVAHEISHTLISFEHNWRDEPVYRSWLLDQDEEGYLDFDSGNSEEEDWCDETAIKLLCPPNALKIAAKRILYCPKGQERLFDPGIPAKHGLVSALAEKFMVPRALLMPYASAVLGNFIRIWGVK